MANKFLFVLIAALVCISGCVSTTEDTPSDVIEQFVGLQKSGNYEECYDLMSEDYRKNYDLKEFLNGLKLGNGSSNYYELFEVINETEIIVDEYSVVHIHVIKQSDMPAFVESASDGLGFDQDLLETREIELVKEETGWKLKEIYPELIVNKENFYQFYY